MLALDLVAVPGRRMVAMEEGGKHDDDDDDDGDDQDKDNERHHHHEFGTLTSMRHNYIGMCAASCVLARAAFDSHSHLRLSSACSAASSAWIQTRKDIHTYVRTCRAGHVRLRHVPDPRPLVAGRSGVLRPSLHAGRSVWSMYSMYVSLFLPACLSLSSSASCCCRQLRLSLGWAGLARPGLQAR
ncbi:hypothetical protein JDV02_003607 [Purpureocillium takamizusanense]|uniref:Uncharacterized protein n=1 Tax=Purpureocillium takamizusanense TaxID=2060973 RepID=A0A9Q8QD69_9HYPO|nr:uncharacterized protein JDV02_003607 [Purpureocillium takamizusanense]UNI17248.1 hypothetical protein JDV02_003607 [Purpureocillium takamizusanense]